jgi:hypothetical protein
MTLTNDGPKCRKCGDWIEIHNGKPVCKSGCAQTLVACEYSGAVRDAFRAMGHDAVSCDLLPTDVPGPHHQGSVLDIINDGWDMMIAFPPCTHLAVSGARWFAAKRADGRQQQASTSSWRSPTLTSPRSPSRTRCASCRPSGASPTRSSSRGSSVTVRPRRHACGSRVCNSCAPPTSWTGASNASGNCRPARTDGNFAARPLPASRKRWPSSGARNEIELQLSRLGVGVVSSPQPAPSHARTGELAWAARGGGPIRLGTRARARTTYVRELEPIRLLSRAQLDRPGRATTNKEKAHEQDSTWTRHARHPARRKR